MPATKPKAKAKVTQVPFLLLKLESFISHGLYPSRTWLKAREGQLYVRLCDRLIKNTIVRSIVIGSISINPKFQRKGVLTSIIQRLKKHTDFDIIYLENVLDADLGNHFAETGFEIDKNRTTRSYWIRTGN